MQTGILFCSEDHPRAAVAKFYDMYLNTQLVDATLACHGAEMKVHSLVIATASRYFKRALASTSGPIFLSGVTPDVLSALIDFMYLGKCVVEEKNVTAVLDAAQRYGIYGMCDLTEEEVRAANTGINHEQNSLATSGEVEGNMECIVIEDEELFNALPGEVAIVQDHPNEDDEAAEFLVNELQNSDSGQFAVNEHVNIMDPNSYFAQNDLPAIRDTFDLDESTLDADEFDYPVSNGEAMTADRELGEG